MRRYKVLHLTNFLDLSGQQEDTLNTVYNLDQERFQVSLAAKLTGGPQGLDNVLTREARRVQHLALHDIPYIRRMPLPWFDLLTLVALYRLTKAERYDIVHTHATKIGFLGRIAARLAGVPIILHSVHGWAFNYPAAPRLLIQVFTLMERFAARFTDRIVTLTETLTDDALEVGVGRRDQYAVIFSGIDLDEFRSVQVDAQKKRAELGLPAHGPIVGTVTIMNNHKAVDDIVRAAPKVLEAVPGAHFLLVGDGELMPKVRALVQELNLEGEVTLPGLRRDVPELLAIMDVFAHMAWYEILPRAILQSLATGTPVVVAQTGSIEEIIEDGENGILVPTHDPDSLAEALIKLLRQPELRQEMGQVARESVAAHFTVEAMVRSHEALYNELIEAKVEKRIAG
jgi:glycosyltransferase involved in cell wall biosynthesis